MERTKSHYTKAIFRTICRTTAIAGTLAGFTIAAQAADITGAGATFPYTIVIVTHNIQQATRVSSRTGFMYLGELIEFGATEQVFEAPQQKRTQEYIAGRFG